MPYPSSPSFLVSGTLFTGRNDKTIKGELVVLLKPTIIRDPSMAGDYPQPDGPGTQ